MCGICGVYYFQDAFPASPPAVQRMAASIFHRGPDEDGFYFDRGLGLGVRRLQIIDLAGGKQPISNESGRVWVVYNGEIYNYQELRGQLARRGHILRTASDTEVLVHLYEECGEDCVRELRGMYAFAIWDASQHRLVLARDRLGIKPLYYHSANGRLVFGSEIKAILQCPGIIVQPDLEAMSNYLSLKYVPAPQTLFQGIYALPPGHVLTCDPKGIHIHAYWDLTFGRGDNHAGDERLYAEQLEVLLKESVEMHLVSDVPFGAFLSGGIDSSTIVALMSQYLNEPVKTFSVGFEGAGAEVSELPFARMVAESYQTDHHEIYVHAQDVIDRMEKIVWHLDQPIADPASLANYMVAELASRSVKMVLTGEGGDELFAGYARYAGEQLAPLFVAFPPTVRSWISALGTNLPGMQRPKTALYALCRPDEINRLTNWFPLLNEDQKGCLLSRDFKQALRGAATDQVFARQLSRSDAAGSISRLLYLDTKLWLPDDLLARGDKTSMAASLEARVPLLDHPLVEFAASLPPTLKVRGLERKYLLKQVSKKWLPDAIIRRRKKGFPVPVDTWFRGEAREYLRDLLNPVLVRQRGLFNPGVVETYLKEHEAGIADHGGILWGLLNLELWYRLFVDTPEQRGFMDSPSEKSTFIYAG